MVLKVGPQPLHQLHTSLLFIVLLKDTNSGGSKMSTEVLTTDRIVPDVNIPAPARSEEL